MVLCLKEINSWLTQYVLFTYPFGWEQLGVVATLAAVIVALIANHASKKQLIAALAMQEQSKNIALFEKRIEIADSISQDRYVSESAIRVLFDQEIVELYQKLLEYKKDYQSALSDLEALEEAWDIVYEDENRRKRVRQEMADLKDAWNKVGRTGEIDKQFQKNAKETEQWWQNTGLTKDRKMYNYYEITVSANDAEEKINSTKHEIIALIETYVQNSIRKI